MGMSKKSILALTNSMTDLDFSLNLKDVSCPTLLVCGKNDNANIRATNDLGNRIQNAEMKIIEDAGDEINTEAPQKLADVLNSFWKREK
ncbi:alpha/beta hydrolase, partial [Muricomes intestini]|uniref:alpha/beta fold hydrolase n=1 Tax=Muricomes intestini TaxID=1796634 RepID=UPI002FE1478A